MDDSLVSHVLQNATTYEIDSAAATITIAIPAGRLFVVWHLWLQAEGATILQIRSGSTDLSGPIVFAANAEKEWKNGPYPIFKGRSTGDDFVIANSTPAQINGFVVITEGTR